MKRVRTSPTSHLYPGRNVGIQAATIPKTTSHERQYQFGIEAHVGSSVSFCQFKTVRTRDSEPVMTPRPIRAQRPSLLRKLICTLRRIRIGKAERKKSEMMDMMAWEMMIRSSWPFEKHLPADLSFHALSRCGVHCRIHRRLKMMLLTTKMIIAACRGRMNALVIVMRRRKRQMETLVNIRVANVCKLTH